MEHENITENITDTIRNTHDERHIRNWLDHKQHRHKVQTIETERMKRTKPVNYILCIDVLTQINRTSNK